MCTFSVKSNGIRPIKQHVISEKHKKMVALNPKRDGLPFDQKQMQLIELRALAELTLVYHNIKHNQSYLSLDCQTKVLKQVANDSKIIAAVSLGRTKATAICKNVLAPLTIKDLLMNLSDRPYSLSCDASNKNAAKYWPVAVRFFHPKHGTQNGVLSFLSGPQRGFQKHQ